MNKLNTMQELMDNIRREMKNPKEKQKQKETPEIKKKLYT